jgi:hypothetical protein
VDDFIQLFHKEDTYLLDRHCLRWRNDEDALLWHVGWR